MESVILANVLFVTINSNNYWFVRVWGYLQNLSSSKLPNSEAHIRP